ncbi:MAG: DUF819 family protein [Psychrilyobacter sp.]|nr:DUF819 family protein [Psychrilyobacter sp.]
MIKSTELIWATIATIIALTFFLQKFKGFKIIGPSILCILAGILLGNIGILPHMDGVYITIITYAIPLSLSMFMLNLDLREISKLSKEPLIAIGLAVSTVSIVAFSASFLFHESIPNLYRYTGMFIGTYTGGSANLSAVGVALNATTTEFATANAADYITGMPILILFFLLPSLVLKSKVAHKILPYSLSPEELHSNEDGEIFGPKHWSVTDLSMLFAIALILMSFSGWVASFASQEMASAVKILTITTASIILGQFKSIQKIKGNTEVGIYISAFFLVVIGLTVDLGTVFTSVPLIALFCAIIIFGSAIIYVTLCRIAKIKREYVIIAFVAAISDGSTAAIISASNKWKSLIQISILLGTIGGLVGNYAGIAIATLVKQLTIGG